jgi:hypothetical protein
VLHCSLELYFFLFPHPLIGLIGTCETKIFGFTSFVHGREERNIALVNSAAQWNGRWEPEHPESVPKKPLTHYLQQLLIQLVDDPIRHCYGFWLKKSPGFKQHD